MDNKKLALKMKELRTAHNYTQYDVAAMLGVARQTYANYEAGRRTPDSEALYKLSGFYNISVDDLMHLAVSLDKDTYFDAPSPSLASRELDEYLQYVNEPANRKKLQSFSEREKELLFYFNRLCDIDQVELIEIAKLKMRKVINIEDN